MKPVLALLLLLDCSPAPRAVEVADATPPSPPGRLVARVIDRSEEFWTNDGGTHLTVAVAFAPP